MRGFDKLDKGDQRKVMSRPTKEARGRTFTFERAKRSILSSHKLSDIACRLLVRGTCDRLSWMTTHYYRTSTNPKTTCSCCGQKMPRLQILNTAGRRKLRSLRRRVERGHRDLLNPAHRPLSWIVTAERMAT